MVANNPNYPPPPRPQHHTVKNLVPQLIGFDNLFDIFNHALTNNVRVDNYPPRNVIKQDENTWLLQFAVAGFSKEDIVLTVENNILYIKGRIDKPLIDNTDYIHHGISLRSFEHSVTFPENAKIVPTLKDGMLTIEIKKEIIEPKLITLTIL